jgi:hypothetical protein
VFNPFGMHNTGFPGFGQLNSFFGASQPQFGTPFFGAQQPIGASFFGAQQVPASPWFMQQGMMPLPPQFGGWSAAHNNQFQNSGSNNRAAGNATTQFVPDSHQQQQSTANIAQL